MTIEAQKQIANSFSDKFQEFDLDLKLTAAEFQVFDNGVFSNNMDEKWNIFVLDNFMYWARSWTGHCIYKIQLHRQASAVILIKGFVTRDRNEYNSSDIEKDKILFLQLLQVYLDRDDIYVDPEFQLNLVRETIEKFDSNGNCKKLIGHQDVGLTKKIYESLTQNDQKGYFDVIGWDELRCNIAGKNDNEPLVSLYLQDRQKNAAVTYYFDKEAKSLLGQIVIVNKFSSS